MELLIPGLALVALMVWASTRIKRTAADAFAAEVIDTSEFTIKKPEGWLSIAAPTLPFEAYTKDYAAPPNEEIRLGTAALEISKDDLEITTGSLISGAEVVEEVREKVGESHYRVLTLNRAEGDLEVLELIKIAERNGSVYTFRIKTLPDTTPEFRRGIEGMLDSFELK